MKTLTELQQVVGYAQTKEAFIEYLTIIADAGVITHPTGQDIVEKRGETWVSDEFFKIIAGVYGIELNSKLEPVKVEFL